MSPALNQLRHQAAWHARSLALAVAGTVLLAVGGGFVVAAVWTLLAQSLGPGVASLLIGAIFLGVGLIVLALLGLCHPAPEPAAAGQPEPELLGSSARAGAPFHPREPLPALLNAFVIGADTYLRMRARRR